MQEALHPGPYHDTWLNLEPLEWVMWIMPGFVKVGQVVMRKSMSIVIRFQGHDRDTVIPDGYMYWDPTPPVPAPEYTLCPAVRPKITVDAASGPHVSVRQAAALLGTKPKDIRRMLRAGQLKGRQEAGSWVEVEADSLHRRKVAAQESTD